MAIILWDLDGTIQNSEPLAKESQRLGFREFLNREPTDEEFAALVGQPVLKKYRKWFGEAIALQIMEAGAKHYDAHANDIPCYEGVAQVLSYLLDRNHRLALVTSKRRRFALNELAGHGLLHPFEVVVAQEDTPNHKPHPDPLLLAAHQLGVSPETCMYIGDQPTDITAAHAAGMKSIAALWGVDTKNKAQYIKHVQRLAQMEPSAMAECPADVLRFLPPDVETA